MKPSLVFCNQGAGGLAELFRYWCFRSTRILCVAVSEGKKRHQTRHLCDFACFLVKQVLCQLRYTPTEAAA